MNDICSVELSERALNDLEKAPFYIKVKLHAWIDEVINAGLNAVRKITGYHDDVARKQNRSTIY